MNSKDVENGGAQSSSTSQGPYQGVASGIFKINTAINSYRRLVNRVGTDKDTPDHGHKLRSTKQRIGQLVKETFANLKARSDPGARSDGINPNTKTEDAKLAMDFQATLQNCQKIQGLAIIGREANEQLRLGVDPQTSTDEEQMSQETLMLENEIIFNEATIEERDQYIKDIHSDIVEIHDIYRDLAVLIREQAVGDNIDSIAAAVKSTSKLQLVKAHKSFECWSSRCWWMLIILVLLLVVILLYVLL